jgi:hypothetical protein
LNTCHHQDSSIECWNSRCTTTPTAFGTISSIDVLRSCWLLEILLLNRRQLRRNDEVSDDTAMGESDRYVEHSCVLSTSAPCGLTPSAFATKIAARLARSSLGSPLILLLPFSTKVNVDARFCMAQQDLLLPLARQRMAF